MQYSRRLPLIVIGSVLAMLFLGLVGLLVIRRAETSQHALPVLGEVPEFNSIKQDGSPFGLSELKGHLSVVDFIFTTCPGVCPVMGANMVGLYRQFEGVEALQFVSISVDPARDSLSVLREYAEGFGVNDDRWVFLWMPVEDVVRLSEDGFALAADDLPMGHSSRFVLVDREGKIRGYYDGTDEDSVKKLAEDIVRLSKSA